ncbi:MAG: hypothetical protein ACQEQI_01540 [Bacillota bacterium]
MTNLIVSLIILAVVSGSVAKIIIEKRKGTKCIGCPHGQSDENCGCK